MDDTTTIGQTIQQGLGDIIASLIQLVFNLFVVSFQVVLTGVFSGVADLFQP